MKPFSVLVVDDIDSIRFAIRDFLESDYDVYEAHDGREALDVVESGNIDMVITDVRMPVMGGLELIRLLSGKYPHIKHALMTAYSVDDYIRYARKKKIWNIIPKSTFLDLNFIRIMVQKLLSNDIFGVEKYFPSLVRRHLTFSDMHRMFRDSTIFERGILYDLTVGSFEEKERVSDGVSELLTRHRAPSRIRQVLEELATNAMVWAPVRREDRERSDRRPEGFSPFDFLFGILDDQIVLSFIDHHGSLDREEVLYRLERQVTADPQTGLPVGLNDEHGRGLFISRENTDHLVINIDPGKRTEVIGILNPESEIRNRALSIYQVE